MADTFLTETLTQDRKRPAFTPSPNRDSLSPPARLPSESATDKQKRLWEWTLKKMQFQPPKEDYYQDSIVKPGVYFYRAMAMSRFPLDSMKINMPETVACFEQTYYLIYTDEATGHMRRKQDVAYSDFETSVAEFHVKYVNRFSSNRSFDPRTDINENIEGPYIISRGQTAQDWNMSKSVVSNRQQKERKVTLDNNKLEQRYIVSRAMKATILRLVFYTKNSKSTSANYGWRIMNFRDLFDLNPKKSLTNKTTINTEEQNSFSIQLVKGHGLADYEKQSEQIISFLERSYPVRIRMAVLDFIQDTEGVNWLVNMKYLQMETAVSMSEIQGTGEGKKTLDQLTCSVYCKLCGIIFKKDDASKVLTYKLLWELVQHLKKRNKSLKNIKVSHSSTRPCRVCDMCYMLVVGEHELVEVEQKLAIAHNIPLGDAVIRVPIDSKPKHRPALLAENLHQWRLLVFFNSVTDLNGKQVTNLRNLNVQYKLHNIRTCFKTSYKGTIDPIKRKISQSFKSSLANQNNPYDQSNRSHQSQKQLRFSGINRSTQREETDQQQHDPDLLYQLDMNVIRVHYFFSETMDIEKFLNETEIKFRLTSGQEWTNYYAEGSSKTIHHFKNKIAGGQRHSAQILMFFEDSTYCVLNIQVGLFCDGAYDTGKLNLFKYNNIYFPDENYYNCNPFPPEWMEMFDPQGVNDRDTYEDKAKEIEAYSPKCTKDELNKMIDFNKYREKNKYKNIDSIVMQRVKERDIKSAVNMSNKEQYILSANNRTLPLYQGMLRKPATTRNYQKEEQFLLEHYAVEENEQEADEIIFKEEKNQHQSKKHYSPQKSHFINDVSGNSDEDHELNERLNRELELAQQEKKQIFNLRQTQSAKVLPPRPVLQLRPKESAKTLYSKQSVL